MHTYEKLIWDRKKYRKKRRKRYALRLGIPIALAGIMIAWGLQSQEALKHTAQNAAAPYRTEGRGLDRYAGDDEKWEGSLADDGKSDNLLILVNKDHALPEDYEVELHWLQNGSSAVAEEMYGALRDMLTAGSTDGREFVVASGYRDTALQQKLLLEDVEASMQSEGLTWQQAYEKETRETMPPGHSEHETGLAVDIVSLDYQVLDGEQENTKENRWLRENCSEYGFILRYPMGKEDITDVDYEPWHFRYVGVEAAKEITQAGITLEEYLQQ